jgi:hypothetical protein
MGLFVSFFTISYANDFYDETAVEDVVDDSVLADAYTVGILRSCELANAIRARSIGQRFDSGKYSSDNLFG